MKSDTISDGFLAGIEVANRTFTQRITPARLPVARSPGSRMVITCMDPRVNLEAIGIPPFGPSGESESQVRIVRTIGGMSEPRSLLVGIHLAGIREIVVLMHTDCGCSLAYGKIDSIVASLQNRLDPASLQRFRNEIGEPFRERLRVYLRAFSDPRQAIRAEVDRIRTAPYVPKDIAVHGLLYDLRTGAAEVVVDGFADT